MAAALRVLIAEDDHLIRMIVGDMVAAMGHDVCAAVSSEAEAVQEAAAHKPDLIILDVTLGDGDGVTAATVILEARRTACVIVTGDARRAGGAPKDAVILEKPFTSKSLGRAIDEAWTKVG